MGFSDWFHRRNNDDDVVVVREGFWANPVFDDEEVYNLYKLYLRRAGHCPKCNDFCFIDIEQDNIGYKVIKRCISTDCDYKEDISHEFNKDLGIKTIVDNDTRLDFVNRFNDTVKDNFQQEKKNHQRIGVPNLSYHYYNINQEGNVPKCTGTLKKSFLYTGFTDDNHFYRRLDSMDLKIKVVDKLPVASKDTLYYIYLTPSQLNKDLFDEYITVENDDTGLYSWVHIGDESKDKIICFNQGDNCMEITTAWDIRTRKYIYQSRFFDAGSRNAWGYKR